MNLESQLSSRLTLPYLQEAVQSLDRNLPAPEELQPFLTSFFLHAREINERMFHLSPYPAQGRTGGVLSISRSGDQPFTVIQELGKVEVGAPDSITVLDRYKLNKYFVYAWSKALVLIQNPELLFSRENLQAPPESLVSTEGNVIPAGAIRFPHSPIGEIILSFSGYSMDDDECIVLATAVKSNLINRQESLEIAARSGNKRYSEIIVDLLP